MLILVDCYYPSTKSSAKLVHDLAVEFRRRGEQITILTPSESVSRKLEVSQEEGVTVIRVRNGRIKGAGKWQRGIREVLLSRHLWRGAGDFLRRNPCDAILFYSPTIFFGGIVRRLKRLWSCPAYLILRDIFPEWAADAGVIKKGPIYRFFRMVAKGQYKLAEVIAVQSPANLQYFADSFPGSKFRLKVLFNWTALTESALPQTNYRATLGLRGKKVFLYGGNIGIAQDMDNILRLADRLRLREDIHFLLVGEGSEVARLRTAINDHRLENIQIVPNLSQKEYLSMVTEFDFGLISLDARLRTHNVPGKLLSYLYWGLPVLASVNPGNDLFQILGDGAAGFCIRNGDDDALARAAVRLADEPSLATTMAANSRRLLANQFSVEHAASQIVGHLQALQPAAEGRENEAPLRIHPHFPPHGISQRHKESPASIDDCLRSIHPRPM